MRARDNPNRKMKRQTFWQSSRTEMMGDVGFLNDPVVTSLGSLVGSALACCARVWGLGPQLRVAAMLETLLTRAILHQGPQVMGVDVLPQNPWADKIISSLALQCRSWSQFPCGVNTQSFSILGTCLGHVLWMIFFCFVVIIMGG